MSAYGKGVLIKPALAKKPKKVPSKTKGPDKTSAETPMNDLTSSKIGKTKQQHKLRQAAEAHLFEIPSIFPEQYGQTSAQIVHELRVHQIELEMQNEALRESQKALEESRDRYADLYEFAPVGYLTLTKNAIIEEGNLTCAAILGIERKKLIKNRFRKFISDDNLEHWNRYFIGVIHSTEKQVCELKLRKDDGAFIVARLESIRSPKGELHTVIRTAISDVSDRVRAEENLVRKSHDLDELNDAYRAIADGQEELNRNVRELTIRESQLRDALAEKERAEQDLKKKEEDLTVALTEKDVLLSEIHHRVKNNLTAFISLLSLEGSTEETPAGKMLKQDLQNRARSMALIHETLYMTNRYDEVDMGWYLTNLLDQIVNTFKTKRSVKTVVDASGIMLDISRATPAGLIINELVTNSLKYAFPESFDIHRNSAPTIAIALARMDGTYVMTVKDNGIGLPPGLDLTKIKSLGLKLVNFLATHQMRAKIEVSSTAGTKFVFQFKE